MMIEKITPEEAERLSVASLPTRPTAPATSGGAGFSSTEMKSAFDALTLYVIDKYNALIDAIRDVGESSLAAEIPTGLSTEHTLEQLFKDVKNGCFSSYLSVGDLTLAEELFEIRTLLEDIKERMGI